MKEKTKKLLRSLAVSIPIALLLIASCNQNDQPTVTNMTGDMVYRVDSINPGDFKTYGQGGWGAPPHGNNPGAYLRDHWELLDTVIIGCDTVNGHTITFTMYQAITEFLPQGRMPAALDTSYVNPTHKITVLAGQVLALALNIGFDLADSSFGNSNNHLEDLCVAYGTFEGWTVAEVFDEANKILGGCASNYTPSEINDAVTAINENFSEGNYVGNYLEYCSVSKLRQNTN